MFGTSQPFRKQVSLLFVCGDMLYVYIGALHHLVHQTDADPMVFSVASGVNILTL